MCLCAFFVCLFLPPLLCVPGQDVVGGGAPASKPVEPVGASGAVDDELLMKLVGQDYGMVSRLKSPTCMFSTYPRVCR